MRYIAKLSFITALFAVSASAQTGVNPSLEAFFSASGAEFSADIPQAMKQAEGIVIPPPAFPYDNPEKASSEVADHYLYMPIQYKMVYVYEHRSSEFPETRKAVVEYKGYSAKDSMVYGVITFYEKNSVKTRNFHIKTTSNGIFVSDSLTSGPRTEIPTPLFQGQVWRENYLTSRVTSFEAKASVPAGNFTDCLGITARIGGADPGSDDRIYAPGIGLVAENVTTENRQESFKLISYYRK